MLNRPETLNALNAPLLAALRTALETAAADSAIGVVVLAGAGRAFSSGADLREGATPPASEGTVLGLEYWTDVVRATMECARILHQMPKATIAMMRGPAAGAGLALATACDLRIASAAATFTTSFVRVALSGDFGITYFLTRLVGTAKARELMYLSEKINAEEAARIGLVNRVVADDQLENVTAALAGQLGTAPHVALRYLKRNLNAAEQGSLDQLLDMEAQHTARTYLTDDHAEAVRAYTEKRPPVFKGQ
jgi:2-(1,2-epoxy-1,2-dihydrophenyl)acetyl-CoA isomerase